MTAISSVSIKIPTLMKKVILRKELKPEQVTVLVDSREVTPWDVSPLKSQTATLTTGDYSIGGLQHLVALERKNFGDMISSLTTERERFDRELQRMLAYPFRALICECEWSQIELAQYRSQAHPNSIMGSLMGVIALGIPVIMLGTHERASKWAARMLFLIARRRYLENLPMLENLLESSAE